MSNILERIVLEAVEKKGELRAKGKGKDNLNSVLINYFATK